MKVKFNKAALQEALSLVATVVPARTPKPIIQCIMIEALADSVNLSSTDLEVGINCNVSQVEVDKTGKVVLPADKLNSIVRESTDEVLELEENDSSIEIKGSDSLFTIYGHDVTQYPRIPGFEGDADFELMLDELQRAIEFCIFAAARESTRYAINGVLWEVKGKKLTLVATDGRRLARTQATLNTAADKKLSDQRIIVPAKAMMLLDRVGGDENSKIQVKFEGNKIILVCGNVVISSNLVEGNFPKYEDIIPADYSNRITLNTAAVLSAVRRAALLANQDSKGIKLSLSENSLMFSSRAPETGDARIEMPIEYSGEPMEIGFNPQFLIDAFKVMDTETFDLELGQSDRPGVIKTGGNDFIYIVMPVNI